MDMSRRGMRIGNQVKTVAMAAGDIPSARIGFFFEALTAGGTRVLYFYCARSTTVVRMTKIDPVGDARVTGGVAGAQQPFDFTVGAATNVNAGRPETFESKKHICLGIDGSSSVLALQRLDTCANGTAIDTWGAIDVASAYDILLGCEANNGKSRLLRTNGNTVQTCESGTSGDGTLDDANWKPVPGFDVGLREAYRVMLGGCNAAGIVFLSKADGLFTWDRNGNSWPVIPTAGQQGATTRYCTLCAAFSNYVFYGHQSGMQYVQGLNRFGAGGPDGIKGYSDVPNITTPVKLKSYSMAFLGNWIYMDYTDDVNNNLSYILAGQVGPHPDGHPIIWHPIVKRTNEIRSLYIDAAAKLWWSEPGQDRLAYIQLGTDGSPNGGLRGATSGPVDYEWYGPDLDFGLPDKQKQLRYAYFELESGHADYSWQLKCYRDSGAVESVDDAFTTNAHNHLNWTIAASLFHRVRLRMTATGTGDHTDGDPLGLRLVVGARTMDTMRVVITTNTLRDKLSLFEIAKEIRQLKNAGPQTMSEPGTNEDFTGYVRAVNLVPIGPGETGVEVLYDRWQIAA